MQLSPEADPRSDEDLVAACNAGDGAAFEAIYHRYRDWVTRVARRFTGNDDDAVDVLQEVFTYLLSKFPGFRLASRMTTFLYPAVKHLAIAARKRAARYASAEDALLGAAAPAFEDERLRAEELAGALATLPEGLREALLLRFVDGMSLREIAEALGVPVGTVKSRLHRAVEMLRQDARARRYFEEG